MKNPAFNLFAPSRHARCAISLLLLATPAFAVDTTGVTNTYNGSLAANGLNTGANWTEGAPFNTNGAGAYADLVFTGADTGSTFTTSGGGNTNMWAESCNVTDGNSYTLQINSSTSANFNVGATSDTGTSLVILPFTNSVSGVGQDIIYLANGSSLTFNATNDGGGSEANFNIRQAGNFNIGTGSTLTINSPITGSTALTINGDGTTISNGTNTFSSTVTVNGGSLEIAGTHSGSGTFTLNNGSVLISGTRAGGGTNIRNGTFEITGTSGGTGYTIANTVNNPEGTAPELKLGNLSALPPGAQIIGSTSAVRSGSVNLAVAGTYTLGSYQRGTIAFSNSSGSPATLNFTNASAITGTSDGGRTFTNSSADLNIVFASTLDIGSTTDGNVNLNPTGTITVAAGIISTGTGIRSLAKGSAGTLVIGGPSTYTGTTSISNGVLRLNDANAIPGGIGATGGTNSIRFTGTTGIIGLTAASGDFLRTLGDGPDHVSANPTQDGTLTRRLGFAAFGGDRVVDFGASIMLSTTSHAGRGLTLGASNADSKVTLVNNINLANASRPILVNDGSAEVDAEISGVISSPGATLQKTGAGTLALTGENTYASTGGGTEVLAGVLKVNGSSLSDTSKLVINGGVVHVTGTEIVGSLFFGTEEQAAGTWGSSESSADPAFQDDTRFAGPGVIEVFAVSSSPYENWADGESFGDDANGDGISNGLAFLLGAANPQANALNLLPTATHSTGALALTFQMRADRGDANLKLQHSSDLGIGDPWTTVTVPGTAGVSTDGNVSFTLTGTGPLDVTATISAAASNNGKLFARLKATEDTAP